MVLPELVEGDKINEGRSIRMWVRYRKNPGKLLHTAGERLMITVKSSITGRRTEVYPSCTDFGHFRCITKERD
jgi:hypothetical protein